MKIPRWTAVIVSALTLVVSACARNTSLQPESSGRDVSWSRGSITLTVTNNNVADMRIYAATEGGAAFRIGTVTAMSSTTIRVRPSNFPTGVLRLVASPLAGRESAESGPLLVSAGELVRFTIQPRLAASYGVVWATRAR